MTPAARILAGDHGHFRPVRDRASVGACGRPLPWCTYPAQQRGEQG